MKEKKEPGFNLGHLIAKSGFTDCSDHEKLIIYFEGAKLDLDDLIQYWNESLMRWRKNPELCDLKECSEDECIGMLNGLQVAKKYITTGNYKPTFLETTVRKLHNEEMRRKEKAANRRKAKKKSKNKGKKK